MKHHKPRWWNQMCLESIYVAVESLKGYSQLPDIIFPAQVTQYSVYWRLTLLRSHSNRVHYKWQRHLMNPYISPQMSKFPLIACTFPSVLSKSCQQFYQPRKIKQPNFTISNTTRIADSKNLSMCKWMHLLQNTTGGYAQYRYDKKHKWCPTWWDTHNQNSFKQYRSTNCPAVQILR